jgi:hypothetical protein
VYDNPELGISDGEFLAPETPVSIPLDCEALAIERLQKSKKKENLEDLGF